MLKSLLLAISSAVLLVGSFATLATEDNWRWHGFVSQGLMQARHSNFVTDDGEISTALTELGINGSYQLSPSLRVAGQLMSLDGGNRYADGWRLDYLFLHWNAYHSLDWQLNFYAGRFKNMHWLYSGTRDVPMTRPMIVLPQSVYFEAFRDTAVGSEGLAMQSIHHIDGSELELNWSYGAMPIKKDSARRVVGTQINGTSKQDKVQQASLYYRPELSQTQWGISLLDSSFHYQRGEPDVFFDGRFRVQRFMLNWRYSAEQWELSSELMQERVVAADFYMPGFHRDQFAQGAFVIGSYNLNPFQRLYASYDWYVANKDDRRGALLPLQSGGQIQPFFGYQYDRALGYSHDFSGNWRLVMEYHWLTGTGRLGPNVVPDIAINRYRHHDLWAIQLMYWF